MGFQSELVSHKGGLHLEVDQETRRPVDSFFLVGISTGFAVGCLKEGHFVCELKKTFTTYSQRFSFPTRGGKDSRGICSSIFTWKYCHYTKGYTVWLGK